MAFLYSTEMKSLAMKYDALLRDAKRYDAQAKGARKQAARLQKEMLEKEHLSSEELHNLLLEVKYVEAVHAVGSLLSNREPDESVYDNVAPVEEGWHFPKDLRKKKICGYNNTAKVRYELDQKGLIEIHEFDIKIKKKTKRKTAIRLAQGQGFRRVLSTLLHTPDIHESFWKDSDYLQRNYAEYTKLQEELAQMYEKVSSASEGCQSFLNNLGSHIWHLYLTKPQTVKTFVEFIVDSSGLLMQKNEHARRWLGMFIREIVRKEGANGEVMMSSIRRTFNKWLSGDPETRPGAMFPSAKLRPSASLSANEKSQLYPWYTRKNTEVKGEPNSL